MLAEDSGRYQRSPHAEESQVGDRSVLYHRTSRKAVVLNPTGSVIWHLLTTPQTTHAVAQQLQAQFPSLTLERATSDASVFLQELRQHDLVLVEE